MRATLWVMGRVSSSRISLYNKIDSLQNITRKVTRESFATQCSEQGPPTAWKERVNRSLFQPAGSSQPRLTLPYSQLLRLSSHHQQPQNTAKSHRERHQEKTDTSFRPWTSKGWGQCRMIFWTVRYKITCYLKIKGGDVKWHSKCSCCILPKLLNGQGRNLAL